MLSTEAVILRLGSPTLINAAFVTEFTAATFKLTLVVVAGMAMLS